MWFIFFYLFWEPTSSLSAVFWSTLPLLSRWATWAGGRWSSTRWRTCCTTWRRTWTGAEAPRGRAERSPPSTPPPQLLDPRTQPPSTPTFSPTECVFTNSLPKRAHIPEGDRVASVPSFWRMRLNAVKRICWYCVKGVLLYFLNV